MGMGAVCVCVSLCDDSICVLCVDDNRIDREVMQNSSTNNGQKQIKK